MNIENQRKTTMATNMEANVQNMPADIAAYLTAPDTSPKKAAQLKNRNPNPFSKVEIEKSELFTHIDKALENTLNNYYQGFPIQKGNCATCSLHKEVTALKETNCQQQKEIATLTKATKQFEKQIETMTRDFKAEREDNKAMLQVVRTQLQELEVNPNVMVTLKDQLSQTVVETAELYQNVHGLTDIINDQRKELETVKSKVHEDGFLFQAQFEQVMQDFHEEKNEKYQKNREVETLRKQLKQSDDEKAKIQETMRGLTDIIDKNRKAEVRMNECHAGARKKDTSRDYPLILY